MIIAGSISFWFIRSNAIVDTLIHGVRRFLYYPIKILDKWIQILITFIIPYAFVDLYPSLFILGEKKEVLFNSLFQYGTPFVGILLSFFAYLIWKLGIKKYNSTGS
jgi:ABC-2 type transport system permease protein